MKPLIDGRIADVGSVIAGKGLLRMPVPLALNRMKGNKGIKQDWDETMLADGQVQPNMYPAKYSFSTTTASCASDFVVYPTGVAGTATTANVVAYYNLYTTGCSGTVPAVNWAYNTGAMVTTSPVLSLDGTQVAFIQVSGTAASLVLMKWAQTPATITTLVGNLNATNNSTTPGVTLTTGTFSASDVGARISDTTTSGDIATGVTITSVLSSTTALLIGPDDRHSPAFDHQRRDACRARRPADGRGCELPCLYRALHDHHRVQRFTQ